MRSYKVGLRGSPLSRAQLKELVVEGCAWEPVHFETTGDGDRTTSLRALDKTDFFTKEIDRALLVDAVRVGLHSAKDLPDPLPEGLCIAAITEGVDSSDSLVYAGELEDVRTIGTSSHRRDEAARKLCPKATSVDIRGNIHERLALVESGQLDSVVIAEAALIRLGLTHLKRVRLPGETVPYQGQLAIVVREGDEEMKLLFAPLDSRPIHRALYLGLSKKPGMFHYPVIKIQPLEADLGDIASYTHVIFTSKTAVHELLRRIPPESIANKQLLTVGKMTAASLRKYGLEADLIAQNECAEGLVEAMQTLDLSNAHFFWPHSELSRPVLRDFLQEKRYHECALYRPLPQVPFPAPSLDPIDELIFTSPSCISAFLEIYGDIPSGKQITCQGPITKKFLKSTQAVL